MGFLMCPITSAQDVNDDKEYISFKEYSTLDKKYNSLNKDILKCFSEIKRLETNQSSLLTENENNKVKIDSLTNVLNGLKEIQVSDKCNIEDKILKTNNSVDINKAELNSRTQWGIIATIVIILLLIIITVFVLKKLKKGSSSIDDVRKAQDALQSAQTKMQEESVKLDSKLVELIEKQMGNVSVQTNTEPDHSLALKVADEIVRIEYNLSKMDPSIKGYKPLSKAVERMKDNFNANGYEIVDMLGKKYDDGMRVIATFITDESLEDGQQIITKVKKPQVIFNGKMIQAAEIQVSQSE